MNMYCRVEVQLHAS